MEAAYPDRPRRSSDGVFWITGVIVAASILVVVATIAIVSEDMSRQAVSREWYEGGTLHKKTALEWQTASPEDKPATCSDFVAGMWEDGNLKPSIADNVSTADDFRPYAQELVSSC